MPKTKIAPEHMTLQNKVKTILTRSFQLKKIDEPSLLACLYILSQAQSQYELEAFINLFSDSFPVLKEIGEQQVESAKESLESRVREALSRVVKTAPLKATEIAKASQEPGMTWEKLVARYPELK